MTSDPSQNDDNLAAAVKAMEDLVDEAVQVYELDKEKVNVTDDLYNSLKILTGYLGFTVDLPAELLDLPAHTRAILAPSLDVLIIKPNFKSEQKRLDQCTLDEISNILRFAIPMIIDMAKTDRTLKSKKIAFLREGTKKLKRLPGTSVDDSMVTDNIRMEKTQ
ncbi:MAG: hypothetical protein AUI62_04450 [Thaumarchaeota archaeon 13_1_40CM_2_39_7]|nr:MAG: hypothetical protein AUI62_04450 [Thaumarchaeota archaeon 13_1_40CM_2_39_7]